MAPDGGAHRPHDGGGLGETAGARAPAREPPLLRPHHLDTAFGQRRHVRLDGRVRPHLRVHRRREHDRGGRRQRRQGHHVPAAAVGQACEAVGRRGGDHEDVGAPRDLDVRLRLLRLEHVDNGFAARQGLEREGRDEARGRLRHQDLDIGARLPQLAGEIGRLVGGDAARDAEDDGAPGERLLAIRCGRFSQHCGHKADTAPVA